MSRCQMCSTGAGSCVSPAATRPLASTPRLLFRNVPGSVAHHLPGMSVICILLAQQTLFCCCAARVQKRRLCIAPPGIEVPKAPQLIHRDTRHITRVADCHITGEETAVPPNQSASVRDVGCDRASLHRDVGRFNVPSGGATDFPCTQRPAG